MANVVDKQITHEGWRNAVVKLTGVLDTSDVNEVSVVAPADFSNNDNRAGVLSGFRVDHITYAIGDGIEVLLAWNAVTPRQIAPLSGRGKIDSSEDGGFLPNPNDVGYDGSINLSTSGFGPGASQNFTVFLRLVKLYSQQ